MSDPRISMGTLGAGLAFLLMLTGCGGTPHEYMAGDPEEFPRIRFADSRVSVNDRCPVTKKKLNPRIDALYVNGRPVGFC